MIRLVNIDQVNPGDTVLHNGHLKTVCKNNINFSTFMGVSLFGDTYNLGHKPIKLITNVGAYLKSCEVTV